MLNPALYNALKAVFGYVQINKEDVRADIAPIPGTASDWRFLEGGENGEQYRINCPFCDDKKQHLYISYLSYTAPEYVTEDGQHIPLKRGDALAHCFRRDCLADSGHREDLNRLIGFGLATQGAAPTTTEVRLPGIYCQEPDAEQLAPSVSAAVTLEGIHTWVPDYQPVSIETPSEVLEYLRERRVTTQDVERWRIGWGPIKSPRSGKYLGDGEPWVIFPLVQHGKLVGIQARALPQYQHGELRYWLHPNCRKSTVVGGIDSAQALGVAVICEGIFDAVAVGAPGVCTFGHTPSKYQQMLLGSLDYGIIWLPDNENKPGGIDTFGIAERQCDRWRLANQFSKGAHIVRLPAKDAGSLTRQQIWDTICEQVPEPMLSFVTGRLIPYL